ncbi:MAG: carboxypeptidase regulatory-like domain-containing protein, partial [Terriglobales bacterium]
MPSVSFKKALSLLLFLALIALHLPAQTVTGTIRGRVADISGAVVAGAKLTAKDSATGLTREAVSNAEGYYTFNFLPIGSYEITVANGGFQQIKRMNVRVDLNNTTVTDFSLKPAGGDQAVEVVADAEPIDTTSGEIKTTLDAKTIEDRPLPTRNFLHLAETVPGFQTNAVSGQNNPTTSSGSSVNFNGTGTRAASFQVNGVNNDDSSENQNRQGVNISTIQQVQVLRNNFSSEFGRSYGSVILVQTKQGTNRLHGDGYWYHVNSATTANEFYRNALGKTSTGAPVAPVPVQRRHQFGGTIGGPIVPNKMFFYGSYDQIKNGGFRSYSRFVLLPSERTPAASVTDPANRAFIQSIIDRIPNVAPNNVANQNLVTTQKFSFPAEDYSGRYDWNVNTSNSVFVRYQYSHQIFGAEDITKGEQAQQNNRQQNVGITWTHIFSPRQSGEFRYGLGRRRTTVNIADGNTTPIVRIAGVTNGPIIGNAGAFPILRYQTDHQYVYNHLWMLSPTFTLKAGTDIRLQQLNDLADSFSRGFWTFGATVGTAGQACGAGGPCTGVQNLLRGFVTAFTRGYGPFSLGNRNKEFNFYAQGDWKVRPNLTLNLGLRNEAVREPQEVKNLIDYGFDHQPIALEPRFGFAFSPYANTGSKFVIRGGYGIFHGRVFQSVFSQGGASLRFNPPNAAQLSFNNTFSVADPSAGFVFVPGAPTTRIAITRVDPEFRMPYTQQWNLTAEHELPWKMALSMSYIGNRGIGLVQYDILNRPEFPTVAPNHPYVGATFRGVTFNCIDANGANANPIPGCISTTQPRLNERRPDPLYSTITQVKNGAWSYYNAMQVSVNKRLSHGLAFQTNYTWSKAIDTGSEATFSGIDTNFPAAGKQQAKSLRAVSLFDTPHRATVNFSYELPFLKSQRGVIGRILGGWQVSGTGIFSSGNPFTVFAGYDLNADGVGGDRPDILDLSVLGRSIDNGRLVGASTSITQSTTQLNTSMFSSTTASTRPFRPGATEQGTLGRNT